MILLHALTWLFLCPCPAVDPPQGLPELPKLPDPTSAPATPQPWKPQLNQPAPEPGLCLWIDEQNAKPNLPKTVQTSATGGMLPSSRKGKSLAELSDHVLIVHTFAWDDAAATGKALPLVRDLLVANSDRRLAAIGIANGTDMEAARGKAQSLLLEHPIAMHDFVNGACTYVDLASRPACFAFIVGRGGGLLWSGDPVADEKGFLAAVRQALALQEVARIPRPLHARLGKALGDYYAGRLSRALAQAGDERKLAEKTADAALLEDAKLLENLALEAQHTWLRQLSESAANKNATRFVALSEACEIAFARGEVAKDLERLEKEVHKDGFFEMRLLDSKKYLDLLEDRPVLFPARKETAGDRFAKKLDGFARATSNSTEETRTAQALADRYKFMAR